MPLWSGTDQAALAAAAQHLAQGQLVAFPTETVYGLGARADDDAAVARIFAAKGRPSDHPLIVHVVSTEAALGFATSVSDQARRLMAAFWPGPLTVIVRRRPGQGSAAAGGQGTIGLRMPAHPVAQALLKAAATLGVAGVAAPSANRFGHVSPTTAAHVVDEFGAALWVLDGGSCPVGIESAIVDCSGDQPALLRPGVLTRAAIEQVLGVPLAAPGLGSPRAPGSLDSHYAPSARLHLVPAQQLAQGPPRSPPAADDADLADLARSGDAVYSRLAPAAGAAQVWRAMPADAAAVAHELFAVLREFDAAGVSSIWVESPPPGPEWDGVRDRLERAATR